MKVDKFYINCPYDEKDLAKALGAKWDKDERKWYVPKGVDKDKFKRWGPRKITKSPYLRVIK